jgi:hypothetical protein
MRIQKSRGQAPGPWLDRWSENTSGSQVFSDMLHLSYLWPAQLRTRRILATTEKAELSLSTQIDLTNFGPLT